VFWKDGSWHHTLAERKKQSKAQKGRACFGWSKGLTKETDERVMRATKAREGMFLGAKSSSWKGRPYFSKMCRVW